MDVVVNVPGAISTMCPVMETPVVVIATTSRQPCQAASRRSFIFQHTITLMTLLSVITEEFIILVLSTS